MIPETPQLLECQTGSDETVNDHNVALPPSEVCTVAGRSRWTH